MNLPELEHLVTPLDDPCQYNPAWRSIVAGYLFSAGVRTAGDMKALAITGCLESRSEDPAEDDAEKRPKKGKKKSSKAKKKKDVQKKVHVPLSPFFERPEYRLIANDKWILSHIEMMSERAAGNRLSDESVPMRLAERWYDEEENEAAMKKRIEALLLTEIGIDVITMDLIGLPSAQPAIEAYEKMYFNCRDDNFEISPSMHLVTRMAMPYGPVKMYLKKWEEMDRDGFCVQDGRPIAKDSDVWKAIGATMGYDALIYTWNWDRRAHGIKDTSLKHKLECTWQGAISRIMTSLFTGDIKHEDAARVLATCTAQLKFMSDEKSGGGSGGANDTTKALMDILYLAAPKMVQFDASEDATRNEEIQSRIKSQLAISKQSIEDRGKQVEAEIIDAKISEAVGQ